VKTYTVKSGDSLSKIGVRIGVPWKKIYEPNNDQISNPNLIYPGQVLKIPESAQSMNLETISIKASKSVDKRLLWGAAIIGALYFLKKKKVI